MTSVEQHRLTRWGALGYDVAYTVLAVPMAVVWSFQLLGVILAPVGIGATILFATVPLAQGLSNTLRFLASAGLRRPVPAFYLTEGGRGPGGMLRRWSADPMRWRDFAGLLSGCTIGWIITALPLVLPIVAVSHLFLPMSWNGTQPYWSTWFGLALTSPGRTWFAGLLGTAGFGALAWFTVVPLTTLRMQLDAATLSGEDVEALRRQLSEVTASRADHVDLSAAELRRIERDLHDGAQARLASMTMTLGLARELLDRDPEEARQLLGEAQDMTTTTLREIRGIVRGVVPPVLADRGLGAAVAALVGDLPLAVAVDSHLDERLPTPVESALYFAAAEMLANVIKHAQASRAWVRLAWRAGTVRLEVGDDGIGGASIDAGTGLAGVARRIDVLDGTLSVWSPTGGPTLITVEVPCASSSPRTTPSSVTD